MKGLTHKQLKIQSESSICVRTVPIAGIGQQNPYEPACQQASKPAGHRQTPQKHGTHNTYMYLHTYVRVHRRRARRTQTNKFGMGTAAVRCCKFSSCFYGNNYIRVCCADLPSGYLARSRRTQHGGRHNKKKVFHGYFEICLTLIRMEIFRGET